MRRVEPAFDVLPVFLDILDGIKFLDVSDDALELAFGLDVLHEPHVDGGLCPLGHDVLRGVTDVGAPQAADVERGLVQEVRQPAAAAFGLAAAAAVWAGGTLAKYAKRGDEVFIAVATNGNIGSFRMSKTEIAKVRKGEAQKAYEAAKAAVDELKGLSVAKGAEDQFSGTWKTRVVDGGVILGCVVMRGPGLTACDRKARWAGPMAA